MRVLGSSILIVTILHFAKANEDLKVQMLTANNQFANQMYHVLSKQPENIFFSPLSVHAALSMLYQGSDGTTQEAIAETLRLSSPSLAANGYNSIMSTLNSVENITLVMANKVYVKSSAQLHANFKEAVTKQFFSEVENVDFENPVIAAEIINNWVKNKTNGKIEELFKSDDIDHDTAVVLVNALYFKGTWLHPFREEFVRNQQFFIDEENTVDVPMISGHQYYKYKMHQELDAKILELPYENIQFNMVMILPNEKNGILNLETKLQHYDLGQISQDLLETEVMLDFPKFKIEQSIDLKQVLQEMGLTAIFNSRCDLSKMVEGSEELVVKKAVQKTYIDVNAKGSEAAGVSGFLVSSYSTRKTYETFNANHPFIFMITYTSTDEPVSSSILFLGKVTRPSY